MLPKVAPITLMIFAIAQNNHVLKRERNPFKHTSKQGPTSWPLVFKVGPFFQNLRFFKYIVVCVACWCWGVPPYILHCLRHKLCSQRWPHNLDDTSLLGNLPLFVALGFQFLNVRLIFQFSLSVVAGVWDGCFHMSGIVIF